MAVNREITELIERVVRERFADAAIEDVSIAEEADSDGDAIFRVTVVFGNKGPLDASKTSGIARHIRHALLGRQDNTFPIFSFVSKSDWAGHNPAAA